MAYIAADGTVGGKKSFWSKVNDFFASIFTLISLFFTSISNPRALENRPANRRRNTRYSDNHRGPSTGRGANIRGVNRLSDAKCALGG